MQVDTKVCGVWTLLYCISVVVVVVGKFFFSIWWWGEERSIDLVDMMTMEENRDWSSSEEEEGGSSSLVWLWRVAFVAISVNLWCQGKDLTVLFGLQVDFIGKSYPKEKRHNSVYFLVWWKLGFKHRLHALRIFIDFFFKFLKLCLFMFDNTELKL